MFSPSSWLSGIGAVVESRVHNQCHTEAGACWSFSWPIPLWPVYLGHVLYLLGQLYTFPPHSWDSSIDTGCGSSLRWSVRVYPCELFLVTELGFLPLQQPHVPALPFFPSLHPLVPEAFNQMGVGAESLLLAT